MQGFGDGSSGEQADLSRSYVLKITRSFRFC